MHNLELNELVVKLGELLEMMISTLGWGYFGKFRNFLFLLPLNSRRIQVVGCIYVEEV